MMPMPPRILYATKVSVAMIQLGISGFVLVYCICKMPSVPKVYQAATAKPTVASTRMGIMAEKALTMPLTPSSAVRNTASINTALPSHVETPNSCASMAPTPADMLTTTKSRNTAPITPLALRSHLMSQGTSSLSISAQRVICVSRTNSTPMAVNNSAASTKPT